MGKKIFVDTDVIIDHLTDRDPFANYSSLIFDLHEKELVNIYISALSINNIYYVSRRIIGDSKSLKLIELLISNVDVIGTTKNEILLALRTGFKDFEDSIQYATARSVDGISAIITRNTKDYRKSEIAVFTPEIYITTLNREE